MSASPSYVLEFSDITLADVARVGGKNPSLGELHRVLRPQGIGVLDGFATTSEAYRKLLPEMAVRSSATAEESATQWPPK